jgi:hypothetical protein
VCIARKIKTVILRTGFGKVAIVIDEGHVTFVEMTVSEPLPHPPFE